MVRPTLVALAVLALAVPAAVGFVAAEDPVGTSHPASDLPWTQLHLDDSGLPGATGWFLVPITTDRAAYVRFESDIFAGAHGGDAAWAPLLVIEQGYQAPMLSFGAAAATSMLDVSHEGEVARCCEDMWTSYSWTWGEGPEVVVPLAPGQVAWFGMAVADWQEHDDMWLEVSGQAVLTMGEARTGERVEAVDLFEEASRAGTRVQLLGGNLATLPAPVERTWTSEGYGIFALDAWSWSDGSATITIDVPGEPTHEAIVAEDSGAYAAAHRAGTYRVALSDIEAPPPAADRPALTHGPWMTARVLFADIDIPGDVAFVHVWSPHEH